jgi:hypothetical protein
MTMARKTKSFFTMSPAERDADVARFDAGVNFEDTRALTPAQRERFERARKIPHLAEEREQTWVVLSIDPKLLAKAQARARREGKTFSILVNELLRAAEQQIS